jgi:hypothetical protein
MQRGGGGNSLRTAIATVLKLVAYVGVCGLTPESLRQAKFDSTEPVRVHQPTLAHRARASGDVPPHLSCLGGSQTRRLWRALHDVVVLVIAGLPEGNVGERLQQLWHRLEEEEGHHPGATCFRTFLPPPLYACITGRGVV